MGISTADILSRNVNDVTALDIGLVGAGLEGMAQKNRRVRFLTSFGPQAWFGVPRGEVTRDTASTLSRRLRLLPAREGG